MQLTNGDYCPLIGGPCKKLECMWFTKIQGRNPNTGQMIDEYSCAVAWIPTLLIENSQKERETGAAVESLRNHVASNGAAMLSLISGTRGALRNPQDASSTKELPG